MENQNANLADLVGPQDSAIKTLQEEIERLEQKLEFSEKCNDFKNEQLDQFGDAIMGVIGDKVEAIVESLTGHAVENAFNDFEIYNYESEIGEMIDERLPEGLDDESRSDDLKAAMKEVLAGAILTMDIE